MEESKFKTKINVSSAKATINKIDLLSYIFFALGGLIIALSLFIILYYMHISNEKVLFVGGITTLIAALFAFIVQLTVFLKGKVETNVQKINSTYKTFEKICVKYKTNNSIITEPLSIINNELFKNFSVSFENASNGIKQLSINYIFNGSYDYEEVASQYSALFNEYFTNKSVTDVDNFFNESYVLVNVVDEIIHKYFTNKYDKKIFNKLLKNTIYELCLYLIPFINFWIDNVDILADFAYYVFIIDKEVKNNGRNDERVK